MTGRIFVKLTLAVLGLLVVALVTVDYASTQVAKDAYIENLKHQLEDKGRMLGLYMKDPASLDRASLRAIEAAVDGRVTMVRGDGKVMADSEANPAEMENHRTRPELIQAFNGTPGSSIRHSVTIGIDFLYVAVPGPANLPGSAIRIAVPLSTIERQVNAIRWRILASTVFAFLPAIAIAVIFARRLSARFAAIMAHAHELAKGNFRARLPFEGASEFGTLARTMNDTASNLQKTVEQLQREHTELEKVERIRKDFVINVSHELRTPLASIQGYTETLIDGAIEDPEHNMRFLGIIRHNAERLARLTEDLLTLSRIEQKRQKFEFEHHEVNGLLREAVDLIRPMAEKNDLVLEMTPMSVPAEVFCDSEAVSQILSNLLDNAIKYTPAGGRITVGAHEAGRFVELWVRDTGIGIPPEDVPRLFERFYRVDKARSRELGGTGLGLSIVKHLVAAHGGTIHVESLPNEGSTFFFSLPTDVAEPGEEALNSEFTTK